MSKFKVGQEVRIVKRGQAPPLPFGINSDEMIGMIGIVKEFDKEEGYWITDIGEVNGFDWFDEDALQLPQSTGGD